MPDGIYDKLAGEFIEGETELARRLRQIVTPKQAQGDPFTEYVRGLKKKVPEVPPPTPFILSPMERPAGTSVTQFAAENLAGLWSREAQKAVAEEGLLKALWNAAEPNRPNPVSAIGAYMGNAPAILQGGKMATSGAYEMARAINEARAMGGQRVIPALESLKDIPRGLYYSGEMALEAIKRIPELARQGLAMAERVPAMGMTVKKEEGVIGKGAKLSATMITNQMESQLMRLGYKREVINKMKPQEAIDILNAAETKASKVPTPQPFEMPPAKAGEVPGVTATKEPWMMSKAEFTKNKISEYESEISRLKSSKPKEGSANWIQIQNTQDALKGLKSNIIGGREGLQLDWWQGQRNSIRQAISEGKPVPPEVLKDYPELAKQVKPPGAKAGEVPPVTVAKEPWQMTLEEFAGKQPQSLRVSGKAAQQQLNREYAGRVEQYQNKSNLWYDEVEKAAKEGKPVPPEVLKDYPELAKQVKPPVGEGVNVTIKEVEILDAEKRVEGRYLGGRGKEGTFVTTERGENVPELVKLADEGIIDFTTTTTGYGQDTIQIGTIIPGKNARDVNGNIAKFTRDIDIGQSRKVAEAGEVPKVTPGAIARDKLDQMSQELTYLRNHVARLKGSKESTDAELAEYFNDIKNFFSKWLPDKTDQLLAAEQSLKAGAKRDFIIDAEGLLGQGHLKVDAYKRMLSEETAKIMPKVTPEGIPPTTTPEMPPGTVKAATPEAVGAGIPQGITPEAKQTRLNFLNSLLDGRRIDQPTYDALKTAYDSGNVDELRKFTADISKPEAAWAYAAIEDLSPTVKTAMPSGGAVPKVPLPPREEPVPSATWTQAEWNDYWAKKPIGEVPGKAVPPTGQPTGGTFRTTQEAATAGTPRTEPFTGQTPPVEPITPGGTAPLGETPTGIGTPVQVPQPKAERAIDRITRIAKERIRQAGNLGKEPPAGTTVKSGVDFVTPILNFLKPARKMVGRKSYILHSMVSESGARIDASVNQLVTWQPLLNKLKSTFGDDVLHGGKDMTIQFIGTADQAASPVTGTLKDIVENPQLYNLTADQKATISAIQRHGDLTREYVVNEYGATIRQFPHNPDGAFLSTVSKGEDIGSIMEREEIAAGRTHALPRNYMTVRDRLLADPTFDPELDVVKIIQGMDRFKSTAAGGVTYRTLVGGLTREQVLATGYPDRYIEIGLGINKYFLKDDAKLILESRKAANIPILRVIEDVRAGVFTGDFSPFTIQGQLHFLADPVGTAEQLIGGIKKIKESGKLFGSMSLDELAADIGRDPETWSRFAQLMGHIPGGAAAQELAVGYLHIIPGYTKANQGMYILVTRQSRALWDNQVKILMKSGVSQDVAEAAAASIVGKVIPLADPTLSGLSQRRATLLRALPTSYSFLTQPASLMAKATKAYVKMGLKQTLTPQEKLAAISMTSIIGTTMSISASSGAISAQVKGRDVKQAIKDAFDPNPNNGNFSALIIGDTRIPLAQPFRAAFRAVYPRTIPIEGMPIPVPFAGLWDYGANRVNPAIAGQFDLIRNKDWDRRVITKGTFPENVLRNLAYEVEIGLPLTAGTVVGNIRTGEWRGWNIPKEAGGQVLGVNIRERNPVAELRRTEDWDKQHEPFKAIPSNSLLFKIAKKNDPTLLSKNEYRQRNPKIDAQLFLMGDVDSLKSGNAVNEASKIIQDNLIDPDRIEGIRKRKEDIEEAKEGDVVLTRNQVDTLILLLESLKPATGQTQPVSTPSPTQRPNVPVQTPLPPVVWPSRTPLPPIKLQPGERFR